MVTPFRAFPADLPGYHTFLSLHLPAASTTACSVQLLDFDLDGGLIPSDSLYTVPVRQARGLPPASFRFHLTVDTLAFGCIFPAAGQIPDFHRLETCAAGRTTPKACPTGAGFSFIHRYEREPNAEIRKGTEPAGSVSRSGNGCKIACHYSFRDI